MSEIIEVMCRVCHRIIQRDWGINFEDHKCPYCKKVKDGTLFPIYDCVWTNDYGPIEEETL